MALNPVLKKGTAYVLLFASLNLTIGCRTYYRAENIDASSTEKKQSSLKTLGDSNKYFILRKGNQSYAMSNVAITQSTTLTANLSAVPAEHQLYLDKDTSAVFSTAKKQPSVLEEVHVFVNNLTPVDASKPFTVSLNNIERIEVLGKDKKRTTLSYLWIALGIVVATAIIIIITGKDSSAPASTPGPGPGPGPAV